MVKISTLFMSVLICLSPLQAAVQIGDVSGGSPDPGGLAAGRMKLETVSCLIRTLQEQGLLQKTEREIEMFLVDSLLGETSAERFSEPAGTFVENTASRCGDPVPFPKDTLYLPIHVVNGDLAKVVQDLGLEERYAETRTVIFDLRHAIGAARPAQVKKLLDRFPFTVRPCAVLIDAHTAGGAECLAAALSFANHAILLGEPTRGIPYRLSRLNVTGDLSVSVPQKPGEAAFVWPPAPLKPDIVVTGGQGVGTAPATTSAPLSARDPVLSRALDMLSMAAVLSPPETRVSGTGDETQVEK